MKNFSIVTARLAGALLIAGLSAAPALAAVCTFKPDAPDQHKVVKGDTLWDISRTFLDNPWCWPQVWGMNQDKIRDPHWIYPGQVIYFDRANQRLSLTPPGADPGDTRLSPRVREEGLGSAAIPAIPAAVIEPFLTRPLVVGEDELLSAPRIAALREGRTIIGKDDKVYVRGDLKGAATFNVYRPGKALRDPENGRLLGYEAIHLGTAGVRQRSDAADVAHVFTILDSKQEMAIGDRLMPASAAPLVNYVPHAPATPVKARVVSIHDGTEYAGKHQVVVLNRGSVDGLDIGSVLHLYHFERTVKEPTGEQGLFGAKTEKFKLPAEQFGSLFVFRVFSNVAYGLVMDASEPVVAGDGAKSPE